ncbi:MAG: 3'(2'),5'-bisphosphate nucleotidase CysQ [Tepidamorphaceae bacterium]|nr:3'(2'),5'-bisphosphate nucleotidase CysQ [Rhodobiaceae bacterium]MCC0048340.1 3'(2'),5'-bisphosphate nucleotidase CysQ [Rhodobiaceae bacterium]
MTEATPYSRRPDTGARLAEIAIHAGRTILDVYAGTIGVEQKEDRSPVTEADRRAEKIITPLLNEMFPGVPVIAEEAASAGQIPEHGGTFFLVDPLDGTREFIARRGEFTVNIGLIENHEPVAGVVYAPAWREDHGWMCFADPVSGAFEADIHDPAGAGPLPERSAWRPISVRKPPADGLIAVASRSHLSAETSAFLDALAVAETVSAGSALKFCLVARGDADVYPRLSPTMEWDTAAGDAVLRAAGGCVVGTDSKPFTYGRNPGHYKNPSFVAWGRATAPDMAVLSG